MAEDFEFSVTATCMQYGMGAWDVVRTVPWAERLAFYFHVARSEGYNVDWETGEIWRPT